MLIINKIDRHYCITSFNTVTTDSFNPQIKLFLAYMYDFHTKSIVKLVITCHTSRLHSPHDIERT